MFIEAKQTMAKAKLIKNAKLGTVRLIAAFTVNDKFSQLKADYISSDFRVDALSEEIVKAAEALGTSNIDFISR